MSNAVYSETFNKLRKLNVRLFTTEKLFKEVLRHFDFADMLVDREGSNSPSVLAAATGDLPYSKSNAFLEGFINWQAAGNPCDWEKYLFDIFMKRTPTIEDIEITLQRRGIEILGISDWPGFKNSDFGECEEYAGRIVKKIFEWVGERDVDDLRDPYKKAQPEAEALIIVKRERHGEYCIISEPTIMSPAWFISDTSILNTIESGMIVTWQPEAFVRFVFTLSSSTEKDSADRAFESILLSIARSGLSILSDEAVSIVFGGVIDQARVSICEQRQYYEESLGVKYGESAEKVIDRLSMRFRPIGIIQLAEERAQAETERRIVAEKITAESVRNVKTLNEEIGKLQKIKRKQEERKSRTKRKQRRNKSKKGGQKRRS